MQNVEKPWIFVEGDCENPEEAKAYRRLGYDYGAKIEIDEVDPNKIIITEREPGAVSWAELFRAMSQMPREKLAKEEEIKERTIIQPADASQIPESAVTTLPVTESYISHLLNQVASFFKPPAKPMRQSGQSV